MWTKLACYLDGDFPHGQGRGRRNRKEEERIMGKRWCFGGGTTQNHLVLRTVSTDCCSLGTVGGIQSKISGIGLRRAGFESAPLRAPETPFNSSQDIFRIILHYHSKTLKAGCFLGKGGLPCMVVHPCSPSNSGGQRAGLL